MLRLSENLYTWNTFNEEKQLHFNGFLVTLPQGTVVIDPPPLSPGDQIFVKQKLKIQPKVAVITNKHHLRDVAWWQETFRTPMAMHQNESNDHDYKPAMGVREGDVIAGELEVIHLPGKTPGEIALLWRKDGGTLFIGDAIIGDPPGSLRLLAKEKLQNQEQLEESLQKLRGLAFERLLLADGEPLLANAKALTLKFLNTLVPARAA